jgi:hypothetical protein
LREGIAGAFARRTAGESQVDGEDQSGDGAES